jgi:hypothetical protein
MACGDLESGSLGASTYKHVIVFHSWITDCNVDM